MKHNVQQSEEEKIMKHNVEPSQASTSRRSFLRTGLAVGGAGAIGAGLLANGLPAFAAAGSGGLTPGDAAILRFLAAAEILETDLWQQYNELGGIQDSEIPGGSGSAAYTAALQVLDSDMPQYIHDNTEDEISHFTFINAYLASRARIPSIWINFARCRAVKRQAPSNRTAHQPHAAHRGHQLLDSVPQPHQNPDLGDTFPQQSRVC